MRRLQPALAVGHPARLERADRVLARRRRSATRPKPRKPGQADARRAGRRGGRSRPSGSACQVSTMRVGDDVAGAVEDPAAQPDRARCPRGDDVRAVVPGEPDGQVGADGGARRGAAAGRASGRTAAARSRRVGPLLGRVGTRCDAPSAVITRRLRRPRSRTASGPCRAARCPTRRPAPSCPRCARGRSG